DPLQMIAFNCDRKAMPSSTLQQLSEAIITRARETDPFPLSQRVTPGTVRYGGLDTGDRCWFTSREAHGPIERRVTYAEQIALGSVKTRAVELFEHMQLSCLFIDARPAAEEARHITWAVHGLLAYD